MLGRNRIRKIERLFNLKFILCSNLYETYNNGYISYLNPTHEITVYFFKNQIAVSQSYINIKFFKPSEFNCVLQIIHEYLYDSRDNNKG